MDKYLTDTPKYAAYFLLASAVPYSACCQRRLPLALERKSEIADIRNATA